MAFIMKFRRPAGGIPEETELAGFDSKYRLQVLNKVLKGIRLLLTVLIGMILLPPLIWVNGFPQSRAADCPGDRFSESIEQVLDNPEAFIGCEIVVEGTLEADDAEGHPIFSMRTASGGSLVVWSWAPLEKSPEDSDNLSSNIHPMSYFIGRKLRIKGRLVQERSGKVVLEASLVEELEGGTG